jgi:uncharacterized membrane protein
MRAVWFIGKFELLLNCTKNPNYSPKSRTPQQPQNVVCKPKMRKTLDYILNPDGKTLTIYGILSLVCLTIYIWIFSFVWSFVFSVTFYEVGLLLTLSIGLILTVYTDKKFGLQLKRYFIVSVIQLILLLMVSNPIRTWQIDSSFDKARHIINPILTYKKQFKTYPSSLFELGQTLKQDIPIWTNIGTPYRYELNNNQGFRLSFRSYYGYTAYYNNEQDKWIITD